MSHFEWLVTIAVYLLIFFILASVVTGVIAWRRINQHNSASNRQRPQERDAANMAILFQTMRDMLEDQKALARQLNENFDNKIAQIDKMMDEARKEVNHVRESTAHLFQSLEEAKEDLAGVQRQVASLKSGIAATQPAPESRAASEADGEAESPARPALKTESEPSDREQTEGTEEGPAASDAPSHEGNTEESASERPALQIVAMPSDASEGSDEASASAEYWYGAREDTSAMADAPDPLLEAPPTEPGDPEAAREAFRALLNIDSTPREDSADPDEANNGWLSNGPGSHHAPIKARVYEYNQAGMTVGQIASELGIGKGEVRLILSLRDEQGES